MHKESSISAPIESSTESAADARLRADRLHVRRKVKNLKDWVTQSPKFTARDEVVRALDSILILVPAASQKEEDEEERERKTDFGGEH